MLKKLLITAMFSDRRENVEEVIRDLRGDVILRLEIRSKKLNKEFNIESLSLEKDLRLDLIEKQELRYALESELNIDIDSDQYDDLIDSPQLSVGKLFNFIESI